MENKNQNPEYLIPIGNPLLVSILFVALYGVLNSVINLKFPGVTQASLRPQILFIFLAGYFYGPIYGFLTGFLNASAMRILGWPLKAISSPRVAPEPELPSETENSLRRSCCG